MASIALISKDPATVRADALVVAITPGTDGPRLADAHGLAASTVTAIETALVTVGATGKPDTVVKIPAPQGVSANVVVATGLGDEPDAESLRRGVGAAVRDLHGHVVVAGANPTEAAVEGALLGSYRYTEQRSGSDDKVVAKLSFFSTDGRAGKAATARAEVLAAAVNGARDLVNAPPNVLYPASFAETARALAAQHKIKVTVLDDKALKAGGYGGLTAVGMGSAQPPRLVQLSYAPKKASGHVALVGKGITFDSGGLSLKPADAMKTMKCDMAGAAAVLHTVVAAARLSLPIRVTGWLCLAENMPSGGAQRPSDVITILGGKTVEVLNTDAEGRLVLADGLVAASADQPDAIIDIATLTGAQMVALGNRVSAVMANDDDLRAEVVAAANRVGEQFWPMPLPPELRAALDSPVADLANIGDRMGGMLSAGIFLSEFVGESATGSTLPWAHLDIAGPAFNEGGAHGYTGKGGTGVGVRTLLGWLESRAT